METEARTLPPKPGVILSHHRDFALVLCPLLVNQMDEVCLLILCTVGTVG